MESPAVLGALEALAEQALSDEARDFGRGALIALTGEQGGRPRAPDGGSDGAHVMLSCKSETLGLMCAGAVSLTSKGIGVRSMGLSARDYPAQREPAAEGLQHLVRSVRVLSAIRPIILHNCGLAADAGLFANREQMKGSVMVRRPRPC